MLSNAVVERNTEVVIINPSINIPAPGHPLKPLEISSMGRLLACALDELDYGILLLDTHAEVLHLNQRARRMLDGPARHPAAWLRHGAAVVLCGVTAIVFLVVLKPA